MKDYSLMDIGMGEGLSLQKTMWNLQETSKKKKLWVLDT